MDVNIIIRQVFERTFPRNILESVTFVIISFRNGFCFALFSFNWFICGFYFHTLRATIILSSFFYLRLLATACIELETKQQNITYSQTLTMHTFSLTEE